MFLKDKLDLIFNIIFGVLWKEANKTEASSDFKRHQIVSQSCFYDVWVRRRPATSGDVRRRPATSGDVRRRRATSVDVRRRPATSSDARRHPATSSNVPKTSGDIWKHWRHLENTSDIRKNVWRRPATFGEIWYLEKHPCNYPMAAILKWHQNHRYVNSFIKIWILAPFSLFWIYISYFSSQSHIS